MRTLALLLCLALLPACSLSMTKSAKTDNPKEQIREFLDIGREKAALSMADQLIAEKPGDYENYLTRNTVYLALRNYPQAMADNQKALELFQAHESAYPEAQRAPRLAQVYESFALTALIAGKRADNDADKKRYRELFATHVKNVQDTDPETFKHLRGLLGESVEE